MHMQSQCNSKWSTVHLNMQHQSTRVISLFMRLSIYYLSECFPKLLSVQRMPLFVLAPKHKSTILYPFLSVNHTSYLYYLCNLPLILLILHNWCCQILDYRQQLWLLHYFHGKHQDTITMSWNLKMYLLHIGCISKVLSCSTLFTALRK